MTTELKFYKMDKNVNLPKIATKGSACFDLEYNPTDRAAVTVYSPQNAPIERSLSPEGTLVLMNGERAMVPTGLIADIPEGFSVRVHPRSSMGLKYGATLANSEAVIDSDYVHELFVLLQNTSTNKISIRIGDRIAQGELVEHPLYSIGETKKKPTVKTDRKGGLGSTGT